MDQQLPSVQFEDQTLKKLFDQDSPRQISASAPQYTQYKVFTIKLKNDKSPKRQPKRINTFLLAAQNNKQVIAMPQLQLIAQTPKLTPIQLAFQEYKHKQSLQSNVIKLTISDTPKNQKQEPHVMTQKKEKKSNKFWLCC